MANKVSKKPLKLLVQRLKDKKLFWIIQALIITPGGTEKKWEAEKNVNVRIMIMGKSPPATEDGS